MTIEHNHPSCSQCKLNEAASALLAACKAWDKFDSESADKHPCPDYVMRLIYRNKARKLTEVLFIQEKME